MNKFPLSKIQEQFWILYRLYKENPTYNQSSVFRIKGPLNIEALSLSVTKIVSQHEILRTNFFEENGFPWQIVNSDDNKFFRIPLIALDEQLTGNNVQDVILEEIYRPFELEKGSLIRIKLFRIGDNDFILTIVFHHIIVDLHSKEIFSKELSFLYNSIVTNSLPLIEKPSSQYVDFCLWQKEWLALDDAKKMLNEWKNLVSKPDEVLNLPSDFLQVNQIRIKGRRKHFVLDKNTSKKIKNFAKNKTKSTFTLLLTIYSAFLNRLCGQSSIIIGVPFTNRRKEEFKSTFGCFMNILPIQVNFSEYSTLSSLLEQVRKTLLKAHRNQEIPFLLLNSTLGQNNGTSLFQAGFTFEPPMRLNFIGAEVIPLAIEREGLQLELFLTMWEEAESFHAYIEYSDQQFKEESIIRFFNIFKTVVQALIAHPDVLISELNFTPEADLQFIKIWNETTVSYEKNLCIHHKFEQQVEKDPDAIALLTKDQTITYRELNVQANRLAHFLIINGVKIEDRIGICMDRSVEMIISIFGVLKAGAAYIPLNPDNPSERLVNIINDSSPVLIITNDISSINLPESSLILNFSKVFKNPLSENSSNPDVRITAKSLAYIIYTSGSTGSPKGVMIEHHSVMNRLGWMQKVYPLLKTDILLQKTPITFDVSVWELFWWSFNGAKLVLLPKGGEKEPETIIEYISDFKVTTVHFVPSMFVSFFGLLKIRKLFDKMVSLKRLFLSGEALSSKLVNDFNKLRSNHSLPALVNLYGPTEATVDVSYYNCPERDIKNVFIGRPIDNTKLFVVNESDKIQPIGVPGELIITGVNLARGYVGNTELTNRKFFNLPIPGKKVVRAYRSGDIVKLSSVGELEYLGRRDKQVKIRGIRIELGDIESKLIEHPLVESCAVVLVEKAGIKSLVAYVCLHHGEEEGADTLRNYLSKKIPDYMVPSSFVFLNALPLTATGKLDRKNLPEPNKLVRKRNNVSPTNKFEKKLLALWIDLLKVENISIFDNFFEIGGNSLLAINLASLIARDFNVSVKTTVILEYPNIKELSRFLAIGINQSGFLKNSGIDEEIQRKKNVNFLRSRYRRT